MAGIEPAIEVKKINEWLIDTSHQGPNLMTGIKPVIKLCNLMNGLTPVILVVYHDDCYQPFIKNLDYRFDTGHQDKCSTSMTGH